MEKCRAQICILRNLVIAALFAVTYPGFSSAQATTYYYAGKDYTDYIYNEKTALAAPFKPTPCAIHGSLDFAKPLPPNLPQGTKVGPTSVSFGDCITTIENLDGEYSYVTIGTDAKGNINWWQVQLTKSVDVNIELLVDESKVSFTGDIAWLSTAGAFSYDFFSDLDLYGGKAPDGSTAEVWASSRGQGTWTKSAAGVNILSPTGNSTFPVGGSGYDVAGPITLDATTGDKSSVSWTLNVAYTTSGGGCKGCIETKSLSTGSGVEGAESLTSMGGQVAITAADDHGHTGKVDVYVVGTTIPKEVELSLLNSVYSGPTTNLLSGIAAVESSTLQFAEITNFGIYGYWPRESKADGGSHIGLMQMPVTMVDAWDYSQNVEDGRSLFVSKVTNTATFWMNQAIKTHTGLPALSDVELENMALVLYGPYAMTGIANQYYAPSCAGGTVSGNSCTGGKWVWVVNTANNKNGVLYANKCRASVQE